jgi:cation diffusion facilitator CzcD-associated flavoprotein CzcO
MTIQAFPTISMPTRSQLNGYPVAVVGAGPVGLAAAAHLIERGINTMVVEAGNTAGAAAAKWGHTRLFSPWEYLIDPAAG